MATRNRSVRCQRGTSVGLGFSLFATATTTGGTSALSATNAPVGTTSVQFFDGVTSLGTDASGPPWDGSLPSATLGAHSLTAVAAPSGQVAPYTLTVTAPGGAPAVPTLTAPATSAAFLGTTITLSATSTDGDLDRIDWVLDPSGAATVIGTDAASPYSQSWVVAGSLAGHTLVARAWRGGLSTDSAGVTLTITQSFRDLVTSVTCLQSCQMNQGLTLGGTLNPQGTTPPAVTITGSAATAIGIRIEINLLGALGVATLRASYDNGGTWEATQTSAATVALTGLGSGVNLNMPSGAYAANNVYQSSLATWADQSGAGKDYIQASAATQPLVIGAGLNGFPVLRSNGTNQIMGCAGLNLPAPGTTPTFIWFVMKQITWTINEALFGTDSATNAMIIQQRTATPTMSMFNTTVVNQNSGATVGSWVRGQAWFNNATSDFLKLGSSNITGANAGNTSGAVNGRQLFASNSTSIGNFDLFAVLYFSGKPSAGELSALDTAVAAMFGGTVGV